MKITFLNHASYHIETEDFQIIFDPWFEGQVFDGGWALLDNSFGDDEVIEHVNKSQKRLYISISHEHPDHFNIPFIFKLKKFKLDATFIIQKTNDDRVKNFLNAQGFKTISLNSGEGYAFNENDSIRLFKVGRIDSYSIFNSKNQEVVNLNDCVFDNESRLSTVKSYLQTEKPIVFAQYGYASHIGLKNDGTERIKASKDKIDFIDDVNDVLSPKFLIPFASFCYFCRNENFYLNDHQNTPKELKNNIKETSKQNLLFMKAFDSIDGSDNFDDENRKNSTIAQNFWDKKFNDKKELIRFENEEITEEDLQVLVDSFKKYRSRVMKSAPMMTLLLFLFGYLKNIDIEIIELKCVIRLSYFSEVKVFKGMTSDMKFNFNRLLHLIKNEFGLDTMQIGGQFECNSIDEINKISRFFTLQNIVKNKYDLNYVLKSAIKKIPLVE